ncbi:hypothetical protein [Cytobacillus firmus]|uniref:Uncharacterized protein n=1 Tax=Cytobacillus firmus TaxID=1399 RepID=A0AA46Q1X2_CYTFI|nr:hypothetical protein [Cytobacillus firmus]UYG98095.1 hypothetical protein OD459_26805 [Cytobacillus firmus]
MLDLFNPLFGFIISIHKKLWILHNDSNFYMKPFWLGVLSLFTQSQLTVNLLSIIYLIILFKKKYWIKDLVFICIGRFAGLFIGIWVTTFLGDNYFKILIGVVNKSIVPLIVSIPFIYFLIKRKGVTCKINIWGSFILGLLLSFYFDPVFYSISRFLPFFFGEGGPSYVKPLVFSLTLIAPLMLFGLFSYGFELDRRVKKLLFLKQNKRS